jgi:hypothetical protein
VDCPSTARLSRKSPKSHKIHTHRHNQTNATSTAQGLSSDNDQIATSPTMQVHILHHKCRGRATLALQEAHYHKASDNTNRTRRIECTWATSKAQWLPTTSEAPIPTHPQVRASAHTKTARRRCLLIQGWVISASTDHPTRHPSRDL